MNELTCPYCGEEEQEAEDLGDNPYYLTGTCSNCDKGFSVDTYNGIYYKDITA